MGILDDTAIFTAIIQQGSFTLAAKSLGLSNGLISRRMAQLESTLGVSLIKRTTRQLHLTPEGELFWQHAKRIQQELNSALTLIQASSKKPKGTIRVSAPAYFGRHYLTPIIMTFLKHFDDIKIDLVLSNKITDPIKEQFDLVVRGAGYTEKSSLQNSNFHTKILLKEKIRLFASPDYLQNHGEPKQAEALLNHTIIGYTDNYRLSDQEKWTYSYQHKSGVITLKPKFNCNDIESSLTACASGYGIGRFTDLNVKNLLQQKLHPILTQYDWGDYHLFALYSHQQALPKRSRLLLDFISANVKSLLSEEIKLEAYIR